MGQLQLINYVIMSISNFWCFVFRLPQSRLDEIESLCSAFLWSGSLKNHNNAKLSWDELFFLKKRADLVFDDFKTLLEFMP